MAKIALLGTGNCWRTTRRASAANQTRGLALVQGAADDQAAIAAAANAVCIGVQEESTVSAGDPVAVIELGDATAIAGAAIAAGQYVKCTAAGQFIPITGTAGDGENIVGRAKSAAAAQGDEFILFVLPSVN